MELSVCQAEVLKGYKGVGVWCVLVRPDLHVWAQKVHLPREILTFSGQAAGRQGMA